MAQIHKLKVPQSAPVSVTAAPRYANGWRSQKPVEDPEKVKRWGFITAKPSEFLIHMRRGKVVHRNTGQGSSCFKWPWDSVAIVPTTINRLQFTADQISREKVGVEVTGLAVYRIVDPLTMYKMLNFSYAERASEKLEQILGEMFIGATRRLVANLGVDEVLTRRKEALASELIREITPIVEGNGRELDDTDRGWGVVIDTIEVQNVRILSEAVFHQMQASFRAELERRSKEAALSSQKSIQLQQAKDQREIERAKIAADLSTRETKAQSESQAAEIELAERAKRDQQKSQLERERIVRAQQESLAQLKAEAALAAEKMEQEEKKRLTAIQQEQRETLAQRELLMTQQANARAEQEAELALSEEMQEAQLKQRSREIELRKIEGQLQNELAKMAKAVDNTISEEALRLALIQQALPKVAEAFAQSYGEVHLTNIGGASGQQDPVTMIMAAMSQVFQVGKTMGLQLPEPTTDDPKGR